MCEYVKFTCCVSCMGLHDRDRLWMERRPPFDTPKSVGGKEPMAIHFKESECVIFATLQETTLGGNKNKDSG